MVRSLGWRIGLSVGAGFVFVIQAASGFAEGWPPAPGPFVVSVVDSSGACGYGPSLALTAAGSPRISYLENAALELRFASLDASGWHVEHLGAGGISRTSLGLASDGRVLIAYPNSLGAGGGLRLATLTESGWTFETLDPDYFAGAWPDLALDASDQPHIVYSGNSCTALTYLWRDETGLHSTEPAGACYTTPFPSLALDAAGNAHMTYEWNTGVFHREQNGGAWSSELLATNEPGSTTSLALDASGEPRFAFRDPPRGRLRYGWRSGGAWHFSTVDSGGTGTHPSLALDANGWAHVAYYHAPTGDLRYAVERDSGWLVTVVDSAGNVGQDASLALDSQGRARIAYRDVARQWLLYAEEAGLAGVPPRVHVDRPGLRVSPNPGAAMVSIELSLPVSGDARVEVFDAQGRRVCTPLSRQNLPRGNLHASWDTSGVPDGLYFVRAVSMGITEVRRVALARGR
jgi:hypothetical protein